MKNYLTVSEACNVYLFSCMSRNLLLMYDPFDENLASFPRKLSNEYCKLKREGTTLWEFLREWIYKPIGQFREAETLTNILYFTQSTFLLHALHKATFPLLYFHTFLLSIVLRDFWFFKEIVFIFLLLHIRVCDFFIQ